jgi:hypothetical protein
MDIAKIWVSQRNLQRFEQIQGMIDSLVAGEFLPPITLARCEDGQIQVEDGHHRLVAYWLAGRQRLEKHEYMLLEKDQWKPRCGRIEDLL